MKIYQIQTVSHTDGDCYNIIVCVIIIIDFTALFHIGRKSSHKLTVGVTAGVVLIVLCILVLTSAVITLRCTHARKQTRRMKPVDAVYDEICTVGINPLATQLALKDNSAYTANEVARKYEDEYVIMT